MQFSKQSGAWLQAEALQENYVSATNTEKPKVLRCIRAEKRVIFEAERSLATGGSAARKLCECNEHRETEGLEVHSCGKRTIFEAERSLITGGSAARKLCECNEHRETEGFEVHSCGKKSNFRSRAEPDYRRKRCKKIM